VPTTSATCVLLCSGEPIALSSLSSTPLSKQMERLSAVSRRPWFAATGRSPDSDSAVHVWNQIDCHECLVAPAGSAKPHESGPPSCRVRVARDVLGLAPDLLRAARLGLREAVIPCAVQPQRRALRYCARSQQDGVRLKRHVPSPTRASSKTVAKRSTCSVGQFTTAASSPSTPPETFAIASCGNKPAEKWTTS